MSEINSLDDLLVLDRRKQITDENLVEYNKIYDKIKQALCLQEIVKEKIKECQRNAGGMVYGVALQSLIEQSEEIK